MAYVKNKLDKLLKSKRFVIQNATVNEIVLKEMPELPESFKKLQHKTENV